MSQKVALVTGVTGQDGAYLSQLLLNKGYKVYGGYRRSSSLNLWRLEELGIENDVEMVPFELVELTNIFRLIERIKPTEIYNLAAQSFVAASFELPLYTADLDAMGVMRILEAIRSINPRIKFYQASTSEMFGKVQEVPQSESTPFYPRSPYGVAKLFAHWAVVNYRESFDMHACSGLLFNHESPLRGAEFVTRKITLGLAKISRGKQEFLELGNMDAERDWGFAGDYVEGMYAMLQHEKADDYVLATGKTNSVRIFVETVAKAMDIDLIWQGKGVDEIGIDRKSNKTIIKINPAYYRPAEVEQLLGNPDKAKQVLGWAPKVELEQLATMMATEELKRLS
tara:strand:+ start:29222 stop:30241 length:1020 start_codon:yes stop_codon:yes gene_type:complete